MHRLVRQRLVQQGDLGIGGPAIGGDQTDGAGLRGRLHYLGYREQRHIAESAGHVAGQRFQECRQQCGGQIRTISLQWIEHCRGIAARVISVQAPVVEHARGQERSRQHFHISRQRQRFADRAATLLPRCQAATGRRGGQHRGDGVEALQSQHLLDEVGGRDDIGTPTRRGDGQYIRTRVGCHPCADLGEATHRGAIRVDHTGRPIREIDGHPHRRW